MSRNGSGTYSLPAGNPVVTGTTISSTVHNNTMSDIASEITNSTDKDGQTVITGTWDYNGNKIVLDADGDTSVTADTDDQIDIEIAGADDFRFLANIFRALSGSSVETDTIDETTAGSGVTIDSVVLKDGGITASGTINFSGATISDLGTVTTADIDGGTVDGTVIGGTTPAAVSGTTVSASIQFSVSASVPYYRMNESDAGADAGRSQFVQNGEVLQWQLSNDAQSVSRNIVKVNRSGAAVTAIELGNPTDDPDVTVYGDMVVGTSGKGLQFASGGKLDDWAEDGTWTPTPTNESTTGSPTYSGTYQKRGKLYRVTLIINPNGGTFASTANSTYFEGAPGTVQRKEPVFGVQSDVTDVATGLISTSSNRIYLPTISSTSQQIFLTVEYEGE